MKILVTGDVSDWNIKGGLRLENISKEIRDLLLGQNLNIFNLEGPIVESKSGEMEYNQNAFKDYLYKVLVKVTGKTQPRVSSTESVCGLSELGTKTIFTMANNHVKDYGLNSFLFTKSLLKERGIDLMGAVEHDSSDCYKYHINEDCIILNYNFVGKRKFLDLYGATKNSYGALTRELKEIKSCIDNTEKKVVLIMHLGKELVPDTTLWNESLDEIASLNADVTIIHHPHLYIKTIYENKNIFILGDFIFYRPDKFKLDRDTAVLELEINKEEIRTHLIKLRVSDIYQY